MELRCVISLRVKKQKLPPREIEGSLEHTHTHTDRTQANKQDVLLVAVVM